MGIFTDPTTGMSLNTWVPSESEGPGPWEPRTIAGHEYEFPEVDFWPSARTLVSMGKVDEKGNIEHSFLFEGNDLGTAGTIDGPIDHNGRYSIPRHDSFGNLEIDINIGTNDDQNNSFDITLTIIPRSGPYLYPQLHIGGREGTSTHAWRFNHLPEVNLQQGRMMTHSTGWPWHRPEGEMKVDTLLDLERTVDSAVVVKYGAEWEVLEENDDGDMVLVPYAISWVSLDEG